MVSFIEPYKTDYTLQKSPIKETIFCKKRLYSAVAQQCLDQYIYHIHMSAHVYIYIRFMSAFTYMLCSFMGSFSKYSLFYRALSQKRPII